MKDLVVKNLACGYVIEDYVVAQADVHGGDLVFNYEDFDPRELVRSERGMTSPFPCGQSLS